MATEQKSRPRDVTTYSDWELGLQIVRTNLLIAEKRTGYEPRLRELNAELDRRRGKRAA